ncbi:hypothetical protein FDECE_5967 [Fusarium decemcellulare]|nr:hypothetical protein FDECE_5967 [Fusarium decemcellulare]
MATTAASLSAFSIPPSVSPQAILEPAPLVNSSVRPLSSSSTIVSFEPSVKAPFGAIRRLFDYLRANPENASSLNATYPKRGIFKTAATHNASSDQKFTVDLSPARNGRIPDELRNALAIAGFNEVLDFFDQVNGTYVVPILSTLSELAGADLYQAHRNGNLNYRLCDYNTDTADPQSDNGCGAHTDYGTFSIIFQDGTPGLEMEDAERPGVWIPVPGDATVVLAGWCAVILSGGCIQATRHRVRRTPGVRRLSAVLFVAPDLDVTLKPLEGVKIVRPFSGDVMNGKVNVGWFKEVMGKKWRRREGNEELEEGQDTASQDNEIESLIWG